MHERLAREHASLGLEVAGARDAVRARDAAAAAAGYVFADAPPGASAAGFGAVPPLALLSQQADLMLGEAEATLATLGAAIAESFSYY